MTLYEPYDDEVRAALLQYNANPTKLAAELCRWRLLCMTSLLGNVLLLVWLVVRIVRG